MKQVTLEIVAILLTIFSALFAILGYLFLPRLRGFIWDTLENDKGRYDVLRVESFRRQSPAEREQVKIMLQKELADLEVSKVLVEEHSDRLKFIDAALIEQGKEIKQLPIIAQAIQASASSIGEIAKSMKDIHKEVIDHGRRLERWDGFFEGKEIGERRRSIRRAEDLKEE